MGEESPRVLQGPLEEGPRVEVTPGRKSHVRSPDFGMDVRPYSAWDPMRGRKDLTMVTDHGKLSRGP